MPQDPLGGLGAALGLGPVSFGTELRRRRARAEGGRAWLRCAGDDAARWPIEVAFADTPDDAGRLLAECPATLVVLGRGQHHLPDAWTDRAGPGDTTRHAIDALTRRGGAAPCLLVTDREGRAAWQHAVVPFDGTAASVQAAERAMALLAEGATLTLVAVRRPRDLGERIPGRAAARRRRVAEEVAWRRLKPLVDDLNRRAARLRPQARGAARVRVGCSVLTGRRLDRALLALARRAHAELVVLPLRRTPATRDAADRARRDAAHHSAHEVWCTLEGASRVTALARRCDAAVLVVPSAPASADGAMPQPQPTRD